MDSNDRAQFAQALGGIAEVYGKDLTEAGLSVWWNTLSRYGIEQVKRALNQHTMDVERGQFMPKPADIVRQIDGTPDDAALEAWGKVDLALRRYGTGPAWVFDDPKIHYLLQLMGGTAQLATMDERDFGFFREQFCKRYASTGEANGYPAMLPGWYSDGSLAMIGDEQKCRAVLEDGSRQPKKQIVNASDIGQSLLEHRS